MVGEVCCIGAVYVPDDSNSRLGKSPYSDSRDVWWAVSPRYLVTGTCRSYVLEGVVPKTWAHDLCVLAGGVNTMMPTIQLYS